jgi:hypothetical protein
MKRLSVNERQDHDNAFRKEVVETILRHVKEFTGLDVDPSAPETLGAIFAAKPEGLKFLYMTLRVECTLEEFRKKDIYTAAQELMDHSNGEQSKQQRLLTLVALQIQKRLRDRMNLQ